MISYGHAQAMRYRAIQLNEKAERDRKRFLLAAAGFSVTRFPKDGWSAHHKGNLTLYNWTHPDMCPVNKTGHIYPVNAWEEAWQIATTM